MEEAIAHAVMGLIDPIDETINTPIIQGGSASTVESDALEMFGDMPVEPLYEDLDGDSATVETTPVETTPVYEELDDDPIIVYEELLQDDIGAGDTKNDDYENALILSKMY